MFLRTSTGVDDVEGSCGFKRLLKSIIFTIFWSVPGCYVCFSSPAVPPPVCKQISHRSLWGQSALCHLQTSQALQRGQWRCSHLCQEIKKFQCWCVPSQPHAVSCQLGSLISSSRELCGPLRVISWKYVFHYSPHGSYDSHLQFVHSWLLEDLGVLWSYVKG